MLEKTDVKKEQKKAWYTEPVEHKEVSIKHKNVLNYRSFTTMQCLYFFKDHKWTIIAT